MRSTFVHRSRVERLLRRSSGLVAAALMLGAGAAKVADATTYDFDTYEVLSAGGGIDGPHRAGKLLAGDFAARQSAVDQTPVINFESPDDHQHMQFPGALPFPLAAQGDHQNFAMHITGEVEIPEAGKWSFGVAGGGGLQLEIDGQTMQRNGVGFTADKVEPFTFDEAGTYTLDLTYYEHSRGAKLELFASEGRYRRFHARGADWHLVGDTEDGGLTLADDFDPTDPSPQDSNNVGSPDISPDVTAVPEPGGVLLISVATPWLLRRQRRRC